MFMFRSRRATLVRQLLKARAPRSNTQNKRKSTEDDEEYSDRELRLTLMKRLSEGQLEDLLGAVQSRGGTAACVILEPGPLQAALLSCRTWRWPDLDTEGHLKKLPTCKSSAGSPCCNPYHWSRLCSPESPPPPYSRFANERLKPEDRAPSENSQLELRGSLSTNGEEEECHEQWCRLAYWEHSTRVGRQFPVLTSSVNVFWSLPHGDGLCLETLAAGVPSPCLTSVLKAREKIGKGVTLSQEEDGVWAFNRSEAAMFVNSPALDDPDSRYLLVYKVPPGHCLNIYSGPPSPPHVRPSVGPIDPNSVRISFGKGWGPKYVRQEITSCPTWLEVLMAPCR